MSFQKFLIDKHIEKRTFAVFQPNIVQDGVQTEKYAERKEETKEDRKSHKDT